MQVNFHVGREGMTVQAHPLQNDVVTVYLEAGHGDRVTVFLTRDDARKFAKDVCEQVDALPGKETTEGTTDGGN